MIGLGTDIVEIDRVKKALNNSFLQKVLSPYEIKLCSNYKSERIIEFVAGRFAAKEAIIKCLADYEVPKMANITVANNENGKPVVKYKNYDILVSISHEKHYAIAVAYLLGEKK